MAILALLIQSHRRCGRDVGQWLRPLPACDLGTTRRLRIDAGIVLREASIAPGERAILLEMLPPRAAGMRFVC